MQQVAIARASWPLLAGCALVALGLARGAHSQTPGIGSAGSLQTQVLGGSSNASTDSNNRMIAVTATDLTGAPLLFLVDTVGNHIAVYTAEGGSERQQGLSLVAARNIDLDLKLDGFNDKSKHSYKELRATFEKAGLIQPAAAANGAAAGNGSQNPANKE